MTGFININKAEGKSSAQAVALVKKAFKTPCGHMGTLDPMAKGVLPIGIGKTTRLFPYLINKTKKYRARFVFGFTTDTLDITGTKLFTTTVIPSKDEISAKMAAFIGKTEQVPPNYSAKSVGGKRGYQLARQGVDFSLPPKTVEISEFSLVSQISESEFEFDITCKGGTYIRSLARDLGEKCGSLAVMSALTRTASGNFTLDNAVSAEEFLSCNDKLKFVIPADFAIDFPKLSLSAAQAKKILDGVYEDYGFKDGLYKVYSDGEFRGIGEAEQGRLKIKAYVW